MPKEKADTSITVRTSENFKQKLQQRADEESRTLSNLVLKICEEYMEKIEDAKRTLNK